MDTVISEATSTKILVYAPLILMLVQILRNRLKNTGADFIARGWWARGLVVLASVVVVAAPELLPKLEGGVTKAEGTEWLVSAVMAALVAMAGHYGIKMSQNGILKDISSLSGSNTWTAGRSFGSEDDSGSSCGAGEIRQSYYDEYIRRRGRTAIKPERNPNLEERGGYSPRPVGEEKPPPPPPPPPKKQKPEMPANISIKGL